MLSGNYKLAWNRVRGSKANSLLTMFGIVVGVVSVVTIVSLGEGVKRQVAVQSKRLGADLITVRPGKLVSRDKAGNIVGVNTTQAYGFGNGSLGEQDLTIIQSDPNISETSPINLLNGDVKADGRSFDDGFVLGTEANLPQILKQKVAYGSYFNQDQTNQAMAIIGKRVAERLYNTNIPIGETLLIRGNEYVVSGIFDEFSPTALGQGIDLNKAVFVPRSGLKDMVGDSASMPLILARAKPKQTIQAAKSLNDRLAIAHGGNNDITVLRQDESLTVTSAALDLLSKLVVSVAVIAMLVGGIGIMNIMLVSVSERTHEIGIRKAIGATNRQIRDQFMAEAIVLTMFGGVVGVACSYLLGFVLRVGTNLHPVITWQVVVIAVGVSVAIGVIFGTIPAVKAARKDPIESLRITT